MPENEVTQSLKQYIAEHPEVEQKLHLATPTERYEMLLDNAAETRPEERRCDVCDSTFQWNRDQSVCGHAVLLFDGTVLYKKEPSILQDAATDEPELVPMREAAIAGGDNGNVVEIEGAAAFLEARIGDKVIILMDMYKSGYECPTCKGSTKMESRLNPGVFQTCSECKGLGVIKGGLVVPETAKSLPNTGHVMSKGPECKVVQINDHVVFGPHTGTFLPIASRLGGANFKIMREGDILCHLYRNADSVDLKVTDIINYDKPEHEKHQGIGAMLPDGIIR